MKNWDRNSFIIIKEYFDECIWTIHVAKTLNFVGLKIKIKKYIFYFIF